MVSRITTSRRASDFVAATAERISWGGMCWRTVVERTSIRRRVPLGSANQVVDDRFDLRIAALACSDERRRDVEAADLQVERL